MLLSCPHTELVVDQREIIYTDAFVRVGRSPELQLSRRRNHRQWRGTTSSGRSLAGGAWRAPCRASGSGTSPVWLTLALTWTRAGNAMRVLHASLPSPVTREDVPIGSEALVHRIEVHEDEVNLLLRPGHFFRSAPDLQLQLARSPLVYSTAVLEWSIKVRLCFCLWLIAHHCNIGCYL
jgi:hypothetical protein